MLKRGFPEDPRQSSPLGKKLRPRCVAMSDTESTKFRVVLLLLVLVKGKAKCMHRESFLACNYIVYLDREYLLYTKVKMGCLHCTNSLDLLPCKFSY